MPEAQWGPESLQNANTLDTKEIQKLVKGMQVPDFVESISNIKWSPGDDSVKMNFNFDGQKATLHYNPATKQAVLWDLWWLRPENKEYVSDSKTIKYFTGVIETALTRINSNDIDKRKEKTSWMVDVVNSWNANEFFQSVARLPHDQQQALLQVVNSYNKSIGRQEIWSINDVTKVYDFNNAENVKVFLRAISHHANSNPWLPDGVRNFAKDLASWLQAVPWKVADGLKNLYDKFSNWNPIHSQDRGLKWKNLEWISKGVQKNSK